MGQRIHVPPIHSKAYHKGIYVVEACTSSRRERGIKQPLSSLDTILAGDAHRRCITRAKAAGSPWRKPDLQKRIVDGKCTGGRNARRSSCDGARHEENICRGEEYRFIVGKKKSKERYAQRVERLAEKHG